MNEVFASEKLEDLNNIVNTVASFENMKINDVGYELNAATVRDAQVKFLRDPDRITHTNNEITHQNLLSSWTIGIRHEEVSVFPPPTNPIIGVIAQAIHTPISTVVQEIFTDADLNNMETNRTPQIISSTVVDGTTPVHSGISETSTPYPSAISRTRIDGNSAPTCGISGTSGISGASAGPPYGSLWSPRIGNIRQSTSQNFRESDELNADVDRKFSNYPIAPPVSTQVFGDKLSYSYIMYLYMHCRVNLATESVNPMAPQFVHHGLSTVTH